MSLEIRPSLPNKSFQSRFGFERSEVDLSNWRQQPYSRWSFEHPRELMPTAEMNRTTSHEVVLPSLEFLDRTVKAAELNLSIEQHLLDTETDVLMISRFGVVKGLWAAPYANPANPHLIFSVSKSLTGLLAGAVADQGALRLDAPVSSYVPEAEGTAFGAASVSNLLDMRVSMNFDEIYGDDKGWGSRYRRAVLWDPPGETYTSHLQLLLEIQRGSEPHGGSFRYRSANSDMLGIVISRAMGAPFQEVAEHLLWRPLLATHPIYVSVDREGTAQAAGGIAITAYDLIRVGEMLLDMGSYNGRQVLSRSFVQALWSEGDVDAWNTGDWGFLMPNYTYRAQWYRSRVTGALHATGIHGQWLYVDPETNTSIVKLSSQSRAKDDAINERTIELFRVVAAMDF